MEAHSADQSSAQPLQRCRRILDRGNTTLIPAATSIRARAERQPERAVCLDAGYAGNDALNLIVEIKGYRGEDAKDKKATMEAYWVPGVNNLQRFGR